MTVPTPVIAVAESVQVIPSPLSVRLQVIPDAEPPLEISAVVNELLPTALEKTTV